MVGISFQTTPKAKFPYLPFDALRPTQFAVGLRAVEAKRRKIQAMLKSPKRMNGFLRRRPLPVVLGPGNQCYLIDKHHLSLALVHSGVEGAYVDIIEDLSHMPRSAFWAAMEAEGRAYLFDHRGARLSPSCLPRSLSALRDDPYRDLAWEAREAGLFKKVAVPFSEFRWAAFYRTRIDTRVVTQNFSQALKLAARLSVTRAASSLPGYVH